MISINMRLYLMSHQNRRTLVYKLLLHCLNTIHINHQFLLMNMQ